MAGAVAEHIHELWQNHLCKGSFLLALSILSQLAFGQAQNQNQSLEANIYWSDDCQTVFFDSKEVVMVKVQRIC